ncbi:MAG: B12-binding domain-containing radical SAM protein [Chloroflexi bacterium]|nr:B12-binding domain-containing radical SAM protein [Chloroflexota bacterium]
MKKRIILIQPKPVNKHLISEATGRLYPLGLLVIDALTPKEEWDVEILDEGVEPFDVRRVNPETLSLAGINSWTNQAARAYEIAGALRQRGVPVILGGPHPSALPDEALRYADSICIGEAEGIWATILADVKNGELKSVYRGGMPTLDRVPILRNPLRDKYPYGSIQTARGCPYDCSFCSVTSTNGAVIRYRPVADVVEEFRNIKQKVVFLVDDNFIGSGRAGRERALELCKALADLRRQGVRKYWGTQATQNLGREDEVLDWMYKAGCRLVLFGLESVNSRVIDDVNKGINTLGDYKMHIRNTQRHGIAVIASFIFGNDADSPTVFEDTVRFIKDVRVATQNLNIVCPLPGTRLFDEVAQSGRLRYTNFPADWAKYNLHEVVLEPRTCSALELYKKRKWAERQLNGRLNLLKRTLRTLWDTRSVSAAAVALGWNLQSGSREREYQQQIELLEKEMRREASSLELSRAPQSQMADISGRRY